jgi:putative peptide maturation system protein
MNESLSEAVRDALAVLAKWREQHLPPDEAQESFQALKARHPAHWMNMLWEQETYGGSFHYDILVADEAGTYSLSYCADEETPWPARGLQRINESLVLRVNDDPVFITQVITSLDHAWSTLHLGRHLIHMSLIDQEIRNSGLVVTDEELAGALLDFRRKRRLFSVAEVERWMAEHGTTQVQLEQHLREDVARQKLRRQVAAGREEQWFQHHRADFERVQVARLRVASQDEAWRLYERLSENPEQFLERAQVDFLERGGTGELFATLRRGELEPEQAERLFSTEPGRLAEPVPSGQGHELVRVLRFLPARFDEATREQVRDVLFEQWLAEGRRRARVEWFWGAAEAAEVPAISL